MSERITNEQINQKLDLILEHLKFHDQKFDHIESQLSDVRTDIKSLENRASRLESKIDHIHISWSTRLVGGILGTSAVTSATVAFFITAIS